MNDKLPPKATFDLVPQLYDQARPGYPVELLKWVEENSGLEEEGSIVEIGLGTGKASGYFLDRGYQLTGIELGAGLASFVEEKFVDKDLRVFNCSFEDWEPGEERYKLLLSAQAFHWIDPVFGLKKAHEVLLPGGVIALIWNLDISQDTEFWKRGEEIHQRYTPTNDPRKLLPNWFATYKEELERSELFRDIKTFEHRWEREYTTEEWIKIRNTFSPDLKMDEETKSAFHGELSKLIDSLGGSFRRYYKCMALIAQTNS